MDIYSSDPVNIESLHCADEQNEGEVSCEGLDSPAVDFPVVGIGASAGGLAAFEAFFSGIPTDSEPGMAFILVQHLSPDHESVLTELIQRYTRMKVHEVRDGMRVEINCIYIIPPNRDMILSDGALQLMKPAEPHGHRLPIDFFFRSLAEDQHSNSVGIILSGTGSDGTLGIRAIKGEGGMIMAQVPETTEYDGMPCSAIATGLVDYELTPSEMPSHLAAYVTHAFARSSGPDGKPLVRHGDSIQDILTLVNDRMNHDFSQYKSSTIRRRIERRMAVHQIESMREYIKYVEHSTQELEALFQDLLIGVTRFFRDQAAFGVLEDRIIPDLFSSRSAGEIVRVWTPGCSTGEEAYSIAILLQERMEMLKQSYSIQIFATDIDSRAIAAARSGIYPASIAADVSPERLARFFSAEPDRGIYRIHKKIRDLIIFSEQNLIRDPPFSRLNLISCRNLLIYLEGSLQKKVIPLFSYALNPGGYLFLGTSESVGSFDDLFDVLDRKMKLYRRKEASLASRRRASEHIYPPLSDRGLAVHRTQHRQTASGGASLRHLTEQTLLGEFVPASALVSENGDLLYLHGRTGQYLEPAPGDAAISNILKMAREGLRRDLTSALHCAAKNMEIVRRPRLLVRTNGGFSSVDLTVLPAGRRTEAEVGSNLFLVVLQDSQPLSRDGLCPEPVNEGSASTPQEGEGTDLDLAALRRELLVKEEYLKAVNDSLEVTNEELMSSNEEMQSINEELQSTNEELETSKEELHSLNEELTTVNSELQEKVAGLSRVNNDMNNLLAGTGIGTVFLDLKLRIMRFTPDAIRITNLIQGDVGRPLANIVTNLKDYDGLVEDAKKVLETLVPIEVMTHTGTDEWYVTRILPYRTLDNAIEGVVITFMNVTEMKRARTALEESEGKFRNLVTYFPDAVIILRGGAVSMANRSCLGMFGALRRNDLEGRTAGDLFCPDTLSRIENHLSALKNTGASAIPLPGRIVRLDGETREVAVLAVPLLQEGHTDTYIILREPPEGKSREDGGIEELKDGTPDTPDTGNGNA